MIPNTLTTDEVMRTSGAGDIASAEVAVFGSVLRGNDVAATWIDENVLVGTANRQVGLIVDGQSITMTVGA